MKSRLTADYTPVELLQEIFFQCLPEFPNDDIDPASWHRGTPNNPKTAPLLLCHVCKWWRDVALSSPPLWTTVSVIVRLGIAVPAPQLVSMWLSRSGALPLNLSLYQQNESTANHIATSQILDIFEQYTFQWGDIHFEIFGPRYSRPLNVKGKVAPMLQRLRFHTPYRLLEQEEEDLFGVINDVPQLRSLHVSRIPNLNLLGNSSIPIPWGQLVHLALEYVPAVGTALYILNMCPSLESCNMKIDSTRGSLLYTPLYLPKLHTLSINLGFDYLAPFLDQLILPKLVDLTVHVRGPLEQYSWVQQDFSSFLIRSNCRIRRLEMHDTGMNSSEFIACLVHPNLQSLTRLVIDDTKDWTWNPFVTRVALHLLTTPAFRHEKSPKAASESHGVTTHGNIYTGSDSTSGGHVQRMECHLPLLEYLTIRGSCFLIPDGAIADVVESRWRHYGKDMARLKFVDVELPVNHMEDMRRLREFQGEGLELVLPQHYY